MPHNSSLFDDFTASSLTIIPYFILHLVANQVKWVQPVVTWQAYLHICASSVNNPVVLTC